MNDCVKMPSFMNDMNYPITVLQAALLALTRINVKDGRIEELKQAIKLLEAQRDLS